jgi:site-specific DNA recombinase
MTTCAIYCRVTTEKQKEKHTIESQKRILPALAASKGWRVHDMYIDDGISGESLRYMPALRRLLDDAEQGVFGQILIIDIDRFTRFSRESEKALIIDICLEQDIKVVTPDHTYDLSNRNDRLQFNIKGTVSLYEKETVRERCARGIREKRLKGQWMGGTPPVPYVYNRAERQLEIDEEKLRDLRKILNLATDHSPREISRIVGGYTPRMVRRILEPSRLLFYTGQQTVGGQVVQSHWPAIMTDDERDRILAAKKGRNARGGKSTKSAHLLTGLGIARCGYCGLSMKAWTNKRIRKDGSVYKKRYYRCVSIRNPHGPCKKSGMIAADDLEQKIIQNIHNTLNNCDRLYRAFEAASVPQPEKEAKLESLKRALAENQEGKKRLISAIEKGVISFTDARGRVEYINEELRVIGESIKKIEEKLASATWPVENIQNLVKLVNSPQSLHGQKLLVTTCIHTIKIYEKNAFLVYNFPVMHNGSFTKRLSLK